MTTPIVRPVNRPSPIAASGNKNAIPNSSQIGIVNGAASYADGFPPLTMTALAAGGVPPDGLDMNGILYDLSSHTVFQNAGGRYQFDATLAASIGGYPVGAVLQNNAGTAEYVNVLAGNTTDFNTTPASIGVSWLPYAGAASAAAAGNASQQFAVAPATATNQAVARSQVLAAAPAIANVSVASCAASTTYNATATLTAPCNGYVIAIGSLALAAVMTSGVGGATAADAISTAISINGIAGTGDSTFAPMTSQFASQEVPQGELVSAQFSVTTGSSVTGLPLALHMILFFQPNP